MLRLPAVNFVVNSLPLRNEGLVSRLSIVGYLGKQKKKSQLKSSICKVTEGVVSVTPLNF